MGACGRLFVRSFVRSFVCSFIFGSLCMRASVAFSLYFIALGLLLLSVVLLLLLLLLFVSVCASQPMDDGVKAAIMARVAELTSTYKLKVC